MLIELCLFNPLVFGPSILEPYFDLRLRKTQWRGKLESSSPRNIFSSAILHLQPQSLFTAKRSPLSSWSTFFPPSASYCTTQAFNSRETSLFTYETTIKIEQFTLMFYIREKLRFTMKCNVFLKITVSTVSKWLSNFGEILRSLKILLTLRERLTYCNNDFIDEKEKNHGETNRNEMINL